MPGMKDLLKEKLEGKKGKKKAKKDKDKLLDDNSQFTDNLDISGAEIKKNEEVKKLIEGDKPPSFIEPVDTSFVGDKSKSMIKEIDKSNDYSKAPDEYKDDDDAGFFLHEAMEDEFVDKCKRLSIKYDFPKMAIKPSSKEDLARVKQRKKEEEEKEKEKAAKKDSDNMLGEVEGEGDDDEIPSKLPSWVKFPTCEDEFYPAEFNKVVYDCYNMRVVFDREKTGFEETREF